jgi:catechol 2,3-dioxygenase-like lactoylglutathione lyase family enzyme
MLEHAPLIAFVATARPAEALHFYRDLLGLELVDDGPFALELRHGGVQLRVQKVVAVTPVPWTVLGWRVDAISPTVAALAARGVACERFAGMEQDAGGIWTSPSGARVAWFRDPDGNLLSLTEWPAA